MLRERETREGGSEEERRWRRKEGGKEREEGKGVANELFYTYKVILPPTPSSSLGEAVVHMANGGVSTARDVRYGDRGQLLLQNGNGNLADWNGGQRIL